MNAKGWMVWAAIAAGSALGGVMRHLTTEAVIHFTGSGFPWGTLAVNVTGSLAIGACAAVFAGSSASEWSVITRHAAVTGLLGGFTTFSTFSVQTMTLMQQGQWLAAIGNVSASVGLSLVACFAGYALTTSMVR